MFCRTRARDQAGGMRMHVITRNKRDDAIQFFLRRWIASPTLAMTTRYFRSSQLFEAVSTNDGSDKIALRLSRTADANTS
jgi:hypothetical protein